MLEELRRHREMVQERIQKSFESDGLDVNSLIKAQETEFEKSQENEYTEYSVNDLIKAGVLEYDDSIEKAVYADTAENRKLGRVGQEYHRGKGKKVEESKKKVIKQTEDDKLKSEKKMRSYVRTWLNEGELDEKQSNSLKNLLTEKLKTDGEEKLKNFLKKIMGRGAGPMTEKDWEETLNNFIKDFTNEK